MVKRIQEQLPERKPKAPKPKPLEVIIWNRLKGPTWGMLVFTFVILVILGLDFYNHGAGKNHFQPTLDLVHEWQTLVGAAYAIMASIFAGRVLVLQIARAEEMEQTRLNAVRLAEERQASRALIAARSVMPLTLNVLNDYASGIAKAAVKVIDRSPKPRVKLSAKQLPLLPVAPRSVISDLQAFIMVSPDEVGSAVADILSDLQLLSANAESTWRRTLSNDEGEVVMRSNFESLVGRAAVLHARISTLYPYARRETDKAQVALLEEQVAKALQLWMVFSEIYEGCHYYAGQYFKQATATAHETAPPQSPATD